MLAGVPQPGDGHRKKLEEVARFWARGDLQQEQDHAKDQARLDEQYAFFGLVPDKPALPDLEPVYLWPENVASWNLFMDVQTQWRSNGVGNTGLDYPSVHCVIDQHRVWRRRRRERFAEVQVMERACLEEWAEKARREG